MICPLRTHHRAQAVVAGLLALFVLPFVCLAEGQEVPGSPWRGSPQPAVQPSPQPAVPPSLQSGAQPAVAPGSQPAFQPGAQPGSVYGPQRPAYGLAAGQGQRQAVSPAQYAPGPSRPISPTQYAPGQSQPIPRGGASVYGAAPARPSGSYQPSPAAYGTAPSGPAHQPAVAPAAGGFAAAAVPAAGGYGAAPGPGGQMLHVAQQTTLTNRPAYEYIPPARPGDHPLVQAVEWAKIGLQRIEQIQDYSATVAKRERIGGTLRNYEYYFIKVRHKPFSVYLYFLSPENLRGQEVIYVDGKNNGKMWAHTVGIRGSLIGTVSLSPTGVIAMKDQRYPMTEIGIKNLIRRLIEVGQQDMKYGECEVRFFRGAKINDRTCTCLQVVHPVPRRNFLFHIARIFVDDELNIPIRYEAHGWPTEPGGPPVLLEEYTYLNIKLNNGFTDLDFDPKNPNYAFP